MGHPEMGYTMITGFDSVVLTARRPGPAIARFLEQWSDRWPDMRVAVTDGSGESRFVAWRATRPSIPDTNGEVLVARDERMLGDWDEHGYELLDPAAGPFAVFYRPCPARQFPALVHGDPYAQDVGHPFEPYPVTVVGAGLWLVTAVTPDDESAFSRSVIEAVIAAFGPGDEVGGQ